MADTTNLLQEDEDTIEFGAENDQTAKRRFKNPVAAAMTVLFKALALLAFILCNVFSDNFILNFVVIIILLAMDFWTTKNVSGRLLVGLRWWNYVDDDGKSHWKFESRQGNDRNKINAAESRLFWLSLFITQVLWIIMTFFELLNIKWLVLVIIANVLNGSNLYGYIKCRIGSGKSIREYATGVCVQTDAFIGYFLDWTESRFHKFCRKYSLDCLPSCCLKCLHD